MRCHVQIEESDGEIEYWIYVDGVKAYGPYGSEDEAISECNKLNNPRPGPSLGM